MRPIRILHISDLHLAEFPTRHSVLDQQTALTRTVKRIIVGDLKQAVLSGKLGDLKAALRSILDGESIALLKKALNLIDRERMNERIDEVLKQCVLSDKSLHSLSIEVLKSLTIATSYNPGALDCLCNFIDGESLDAVVITGDLATTGLAPDLEKARIFLEGTSVFDQSIAGVSAQMLLLPGNHDRFVYTGRGFLFSPGGKDFDSVFKDHWSGPVKVCDVLRNEQDRLSVLIIAADFGLASPQHSTWPLLKLNRLAQGRVYQEILKKLEEKTKEAQEGERTLNGRTPVTLWAIHFPPYFPYKNAGRAGRVLDRLTKGLIDENHLIASARRHNVSAILAGHTHEADDYPAGDYQIRVLCAGTATQDDIAEKQCQIIEVSKNSIGQPKITVREYLQDEYGSTFVAR